jgi:hypothetical protein
MMKVKIIYTQDPLAFWALNPRFKEKEILSIEQLEDVKRS